MGLRLPVSKFMDGVPSPFGLRGPPISEAGMSLLNPSRGMSPLDPLDPFGLQRKFHEQQQRQLSLSLAASAGAAAGANRPPGPNSIYEIAALTQELNTLQLTTRVRETLAANNIGQKVGQAVCSFSRSDFHLLISNYRCSGRPFWAFPRAQSASS